MFTSRPRSICLTPLVAALMLPGVVQADWLQWGGPDQDFIARTTGIAKTWPDSGPRQLWTRELGDGYSAILIENGKLYTMYRADGQERVVCLSAQDGKTLWEHAYSDAPHDGHVREFGEGPRATPLIVGDRLYSIGVAGQLHCLDKNTGAAQWSHDLLEEFGGTQLPHGYSSSPIFYDGKLITLVGGENASVMAFDAASGSVVWKKHSFRNSYATPKIFSIHGQDQLITWMAQEVVGLDPKTGDLLWSFEHGNQFGQNICMPVWHKDTLLISSPQAGARGLKLANADGKWTVQEAWSTRKVQFYHITAVRDGDWVYGSTGSRDPCFMAGINVTDGSVAWRKRGYPKANCLGADGRLIVLDEDGSLYLASADPKDFTVHSKFKLFDGVSWTVPTVDGKILYARDKKKLVALDLS